MADHAAVVRYCRDPQIAALLKRFGLTLVTTERREIPGSYWGDDEAGLVGDRLFARPDTPLHSILHEASHFICMDTARRAKLDTDAGGDDLEECAVCYFSILLSDRLSRLGRERMFVDMDRWGYSFRIGSARQWFEHDAQDAKQFLLDHELISSSGCPTYSLRH